MPLLDQLARLILHPVAQAGAVLVTRYATAGQAGARADARRQEIVETLKKDYGFTGLSPGPGPLLNDPVGEELARASALLDEAWRFASRSGPGHPEVRPRLDKAAECLLKAERFYLTPAQKAQLPPERQELARQIAPRIAAVRQVLVNRTGGLQGLEASAAEAANLVSAWGQGAPSGIPAPALLPPPAAVPKAPDTGCVPCARSHLTQVAAELEEAAKAPPAQRQAWLTDAAKQLLALEEFDWTPEKVAASDPAVQRLISRYQPEVQALRQELMSGVDQAKLSDLATRARDLQRRFNADAGRVKTVVDRAFDQALR
mgnify:FL=1